MKLETGAVLCHVKYRAKQHVAFCFQTCHDALSLKSTLQNHKGKAVKHASTLPRFYGWPSAWGGLLQRTLRQSASGAARLSATHDSDPRKEIKYTVYTHTRQGCRAGMDFETSRIQRCSPRSKLIPQAPKFCSAEESLNRGQHREGFALSVWEG